MLSSDLRNHSAVISFCTSETRQCIFSSWASISSARKKFPYVLLSISLCLSKIGVRSSWSWTRACKNNYHYVTDIHSLILDFIELSFPSYILFSESCEHRPSTTLNCPINFSYREASDCSRHKHTSIQAGNGDIYRTLLSLMW